MSDPQPHKPKYKRGVDIEKVAPHHRYLYEDLSDHVSPSQSATQPTSSPKGAAGTSSTLSLWVFGVCVVIAFGAFQKLPYGYYVLVRFAACGAAIALLMNLFSANRIGFGYLLVGVAILYNPLIPVHLSRDIWLPINLATIAVFIVSLGVLAWGRVANEA